MLSVLELVTKKWRLSDAIKDEQGFEVLHVIRIVEIKRALSGAERERERERQRERERDREKERQRQRRV